jgi:MerR family transcriptional regulator, light-induced transcriptional regulator
MGQYSIKELEQLSGIKAHTIRIWEKRHNIIEPQRTETNIRFYSDFDLKRIINVSLLNNHGIKISKIADMSVDDVSRKVLEISEQKNDATIPIDQLLVAMVDLDEEQFEDILNRFSKRNGHERTITEVVYPFLDKIGVLWQTGEITPAHEHFISNLIRQRLIISVASLPLPPVTSSRAVLFLPEGELHELGLLFVHYLVRKNGYRTYYLGQSVPHEDLKKVVELHKAQILITSLTSVPAPKNVESYLKKLSTDFPTTTIYTSGYLIRNTAFMLPKNVHLFEKATELPYLMGK